MTHRQAYRNGKITLRQFRELQVLKYSNPKKYRKREKELGI